jgi:hypothetical protein
MPHSCSEGPRFDRMEEWLGRINDTLTQLSDLMITRAACDIRLDHVEKAKADLEARVRVLEASMNKQHWMERVLWVLVLAAVTAYFKVG